LRHLVNLVHDLTTRGVGLKVLTGQGASIDTTTANGRLMFGFFAALAEFERELIVERTRAGLASARARGRNGGRRYKMTAAKLRLAQIPKRSGRFGWRMLSQRRSFCLRSANASWRSLRDSSPAAVSCNQRAPVGRDCEPVAMSARQVAMIVSPATGASCNHC
jgi:hypothetical protein